MKYINSLSSDFKEYKAEAFKEEIMRIEKLLKGEKNWLVDEESIKTYKSLEKQRNNLLKLDEII